MDFALSAEQVDLAANERNWLTKHDPIAARRPHIDDGPAPVDASVLRHAAESGFLGLLTEDVGGTHVDLLALVEEHGRAASSLPLAELALAAEFLTRLGPDLVDIAASAAEGSRPVLPVTSALDGPPLDARTDKDSLHLTGRSAPGIGRAVAGGYLVFASEDDGTTVAAYIDAGADGVAIHDLNTLDLTRGWSVVDLDTVVERPYWTRLDPADAAQFFDALALYRVVDAVGAADRLVDATVDYAAARTQFGAPIGSFQAVKHHCANMALAVESSRAVAWAAAVALDSGDPVERRRAVSAAAAHIGKSTSDVAQTALQTHGGIGFTWEHDLHLLLRRIKVDELLDGTVSFHRRRLVEA